MMQYRLLGRTGIRVSPLCLGTLNFGGPTSAEDSIRLIHKAMDAGINFIDTANSYNRGETERVLSKALPPEKRQHVILTSKVHFALSDDPNDRGNSRRHIIQAVENSLRRLQTDWIDLYQIHRPIFDIPQDETLRALDDLVRQGKIRYFGTSTFPAWLIMEGLAISERYHLNRYVTEQPPYNLLDRRLENELAPLAERYQIGLLPWSPLAMGVLAGRYDTAQEFPPESRAARVGSFVVERISQAGIAAAQKVAGVARQLGITTAQLALCWVKDQPQVVAPIIGPRTESHLLDNLAVLEMSLTPEIANEMDKIVPPGSAVANFYNNSGWMKMRLPE